MRVELARSAGFCIGVRRAIDTALRSSKERRHLYMLGDIVHNEFVVERIKKSGIKKIKRLGKGEGKTLLIRAHGTPAVVYAAAKKAGYEIIDATCPMVKEIHRIARSDEKKGRSIIIIGDKDHEEVLGIKGNLSGEPVIVDPAKSLPLKKLQGIKKASVVVQSTQNMDSVLDILNKLSRVIKDLSFHDTICTPTKNRQKEARDLSLRNDAMVIIGSRTSANTKRLYEISKRLNKKTFWIRSAGDLKPSCLKGVKSAGVIAGASTPDELIEEVVSFLKKI
jgi:4-hydroxy-3-methylbut-2-enyl diphosphate reductase